MKNSLFCLLILLPSLAFAQIKDDIIIKWLKKNNELLIDPKSKSPIFEGNSYSYDAYNKILSYQTKLVTANILDEKSLTISNILYESISQSELGGLNIATIPKTIDAKLYSVISGNIIQNFIKINPIIKDESGIKIVKSYSYSIALESSKKSVTVKNKNTISNSVLASGEWYRFYIEKSGVYKITKDFLQQLGINTNNLDPKKIKIYGNGGKMLPLANNQFYPIDLTENAIQVTGEEDSVFNNDDFILFYGEGISNWNEESQTHVNLYDSKSFYYINIQGAEGKRITNLQQPITNSTLTLNSYDEYQFHEVDLKSIAQVGRQWVGESFDINQDQEFSFQFPNIDATVPVKLDIALASAAYTATSFKISANNLEIGSVSFPALNTSSEIQYYNGKLPNTTTVAGATTINIKVSYSNNGVPGSKGFLDHIRLKAKSKLQGFGKQFHFQYDLASTNTGVVTYQFSNATSIPQVWDITDTYNITKIENNNQLGFYYKQN